MDPFLATPFHISLAHLPVVGAHHGADICTHGRSEGRQVRLLDVRLRQVERVREAVLAVGAVRVEVVGCAGEVRMGCLLSTATGGPSMQGSPHLA